LLLLTTCWGRRRKRENYEEEETAVNTGLEKMRQRASVGWQRGFQDLLLAEDKLLSQHAHLAVNRSYTFLTQPFNCCKCN
jgi:hypothetical protein